MSSIEGDAPSSEAPYRAGKGHGPAAQSPGPTASPDVIDRVAAASNARTSNVYEALWNLALAAVLVWVERRWHPRPGQLFCGYVAGYAAGRFWVESLRIDPATRLLDIRVNLWVSAVVFLAAVAVIVIRHWISASEPNTTPH